MRNHMGSIAALAIPVAGGLPAAPAAAAADPPIAVDDGATVDDLHALLAREGERAFLATTETGRVLHVDSVTGFSPGARRVITRLERDGDLTVRTGGVPTVDLPIELRTASTVSATAGGYPDPNMGGVRYFIDVGDYESFCTTGFAVSYSSRTYVTSAGHCGWKAGQDIRNSTGDASTSSSLAKVSAVSWTSWGTPGPIAGDVLMYYSESAKGKVFQGTSTAPRRVTGWQNPTLGETGVCFRGATTGGSGSCGSVVSVGNLYDVSGYQYPAFCVSAAPKPGDSGSAMYVRQGTDQVSARGLLSFMQDADGDSDYDNACGTPIGTVLSMTSSTLVTG